MSFRICIAAVLLLSSSLYAAEPPKGAPDARKVDASKADASKPAAAPKIKEDAPIIEDGPVKVDEGDVLAFLLRIPEDKRGTFRTSYERVAGVADGLFIARSFASRARAEGLDKDPVVQRRLRQAEDAVLADLYNEKLGDKVKDINLEARAKELYVADPEAYRTPETFSVEHILVGLNGRTREQARERAEDLDKRAQSGEDFMMLAGRYSDDPLKTSNGGRYDAAPLEAYDPRWRAAIQKLGKGQVSPVVESDDGFHIFRLAEHKPAEVPKFEAVKEKIIATERQRVAKQRQDELIQEIRSSSTVVTHRDNLQALVIPVDEEKLRKAQEAAEKRLLESQSPASDAGTGKAQPGSAAPQPGSAGK